MLYSIYAVKQGCFLGINVNYVCMYVFVEMCLVNIDIFSFVIITLIYFFVYEFYVHNVQSFRNSKKNIGLKYLKEKVSHW